MDQYPTRVGFCCQEKRPYRLAHHLAPLEIAAPFQIDVALGDIVDLIAVDTVDPLVIEIVDVPVL